MSRLKRRAETSCFLTRLGEGRRNTTGADILTMRTSAPVVVGLGTARRSAHGSSLGLTCVRSSRHIVSVGGEVELVEQGLAAQCRLVCVVFEAFEQQTSTRKIEVARTEAIFAIDWARSATTICLEYASGC